MAALHLPGGQLALEPQVEGPRSDRRKQREATKQQRAAAAQELQQLRAWKQARADTGGSGVGSPGKATGKGNNNKKGKSNLHSKTRDGKAVCYSWNNKQGKCAGVAPGKPCPSGRAHACQKCLSDRHRSAECPQSDLVRRSLLLAFRETGPPHVRWCGRRGLSRRRPRKPQKGQHRGRSFEADASFALCTGLRAQLALAWARP